MLADGFSDGSAFDQFCHETGSSFSATQETSPENRNALSALGNFEEGFTIFDAIAKEDSIEDTLLDPLSRTDKRAADIPWPTPYRVPNYDGFAQLSEHFGDMGQLATAPAQTARAQDFKKVVVAAALAGTKNAGNTAQALLRKSVAVAALADDRSKAVANAREGFQRALREVDVLDKRAKLLAAQLMDERGSPRKDVTLADVERLKKLRARSTALGRRAIRYQKVNALATPLAQNAIAQADILQKLAAAVLAGDTGTASALGQMYDSIGKKSAEIRAIRTAQLQKWTKKGELEGHLAFISEGDPYEATLNALERADVVALAGLEFSLKKAFRKAKKGIKSVAKGAVKIVKKTTVDPVKTAVTIARKTVKGDIKGAFKEVGRSVRTAAKDIASVAGKVLLDYPCRLASSTVGKVAIQAAGQAVGTVYGGPAGGALGREAGRQGAQTNQSICGGLRRIGITEGKFRPGQVKAAFSKVAKDLYKTSLSPQAALLAAKNVGMGIATGGAGGGGAGGLLSTVGGGAGNLLSTIGGGGGGGASGLLSKLGQETLSKIGAGNVQNLVGKQITALASQQAKKFVSKQAQKFAVQQAQRLIAPQVRRIRGPVSTPPVFTKAAYEPLQREVTEYLETGRVGDFV
jgi:hypothetical protein